VHFIVSWQQNGSLTIAKLSVFKPIFVSIFTFGHESCVMTERVLPQVHVEGWDFSEEFTA